MHELGAPLTFTPVYQTIVWGGRRMARWRSGMPEGPIGESWDLADHDRGMSVVDSGPLAGKTLREITHRFAKDLVGDHFQGGDFPLLVKMIDAHQRLSVQVHPDDHLAQELGVGLRGKTESWVFVEDGGELFVGTKTGCTAQKFSEARNKGHLSNELQQFVGRDGDCFFLPARTVHALGTGCLIYEIQQTCDVTFRVDDWGRLGLDGKPRALHVAESLKTIDFNMPISGPVQTERREYALGGTVRDLVDCAYFSLSEIQALQTGGGTKGRCSIIVCLAGHGALSTSAGSVPLRPMQTYLIPAITGAWRATANSGEELRLLSAIPR